MQFEIDLIKGLQTMSNGFTDLLGKGLSFFGTELFFMIVAVLFYWCVDKKFAHRFFNVYILGVAVTNFMKIGFKRTRPYNYDEIKSIGDPEPSYSFPSGHTQTVSTVSTMLTIKYGKKHVAVPIIFSILTVLVMLSRMYLGQHYLSDVFCGLTVGVFCAIAFNALLSLFKDKEELFVIAAVVMTAVLIGTLAGLGKLNESEDLLKGIGAFVAFDIGYFVEKKWVKYDVKANRKWYEYFFRIVIGLGVTVAVQQTFKLFLPEKIPMLYCFVRYFVMALWAALIAPAIFKLLKILVFCRLRYGIRETEVLKSHV